MKVILGEQLPKVGDKGDVVDVADGYARNFLIPQGMAHRATEGDITRIAQHKAEAEQRHFEREEKLATTVNELHGTHISVSVPAGEAGNLYAGLHTDDILAFIAHKTGETFLSEHVSFKEPIKETGQHDVEITVHDTRAIVSLVVEGKNA